MNEPNEGSVSRRALLETERVGYHPPEWRIWVCRCPGRLWADRPLHMSCVDCGRLIDQITVVQGGRP